MSEGANSSLADASLSTNVSEASSIHSNLTGSRTSSYKSTSSTLSETGSTTASSEAASSSIQVIDDSSASNNNMIKISSVNSISQNSDKNKLMPPPSANAEIEAVSSDSIPMDTSEPAPILISETTVIDSSESTIDNSQKMHKIKMTEEMYDYMEEAFQEARKALADGEVPVGCIFVYRDEVIARGGNFVNSTKNATGHAEFQCIDQAFDYCTRNSLTYEDVFSEISVFVTVEPCIMCAASLYEFGVKEIIYGCTNDRFGGKTVVDVEDIFEKQIPTLGGIRAQEAMDLLKKFYKGENPLSPAPKKKKQ